MIMRFPIKALVWQSGVVLVLSLFGSVISMERSMGGQNVTIAQAQQTEQKQEADRLFKQGIHQYEADQYEAAISSWEAALRLYRDIRDQDGEADVLTNLGLAYTALSQNNEAIRYHTQALKLYQTLQNRNGEERVLNNLGIAYRKLSQYDKAIRYYNQALSIQRATQNRNSEALTLLNLGVAYGSLSQYAKEIRYYNEALLIFQALNDRIGEARTLANLGSAYYSQSQYEKAIGYFTQVLPIFQSAQDRNNEAMTLNNLGLAYFSLSQYEKAIRYYNQALPILQLIQNRNSEAEVLNNLGRAHLFLSHHNQAIDYFNQARSIFRATQDRRGEGWIFANLGAASLELSQPEKAIEYFNQALPIFQAIGDRDSEAMALTNLGIAYLSLAQANSAIDYFNRSLSIFQAIQNRNGEAKALSNLGLAYFFLEQFDRAMHYFNQSLPIFQAVQDQDGEAKVLSNLGLAYYELLQYDKAISYHTQTLAKVQATGNRSIEAKALTNLGFAQLTKRQFNLAEQSLQRAIAINETIRLDRLSEDDKISLFEEQSKSYRALQMVLVGKNQPEAALTISEWGRTKALIERLSQQLQPTSAPRTSQAPTLDTLRQIARSQNATLVEYTIVYDQRKEKYLYIWVVQPNGKISFRQVDVASVLPQQCPSLLHLIGNSRNSIGTRSPEADWLVVKEGTPENSCAQSDADTNLKTLYNLLIEPISALLPSDSTRQIVFIPDRALFLVPFAALKHKTGKYLVEQHTIRMASSMQLLDQTRILRTRSKGQSALIVGNPLMPDDPTSVNPRQLLSLPSAEQEARAIAPLFNTQSITGRNGTKNAVLKQMLNARIIHLATHGSFYDRNGFKSWLALAPSNNDSGILTAEEIAQMQLKADLVVLSACDTGRGRITGDGVVGLSRSFIAAGVPSVIVSLWSVPDAPTAELMVEFYQQLRSNPDKAQALRQAMLKTLKTHPQPKNWAAFTLVGES